MFHAAFWTHVEIAKDLIYAGADLYAQRNDGFTALHVAVKNNQPRMTEVLVKAMKKNLRIQEVRIFYKISADPAACPAGLTRQTTASVVVVVNRI